MKSIHPTLGKSVSRYLLAFLCIVFFASDSVAEPPEPEFMKRLYPPELVMKNNRAIELTRDQRKLITQAMMAIEGPVKRAHLGLLIEIRNTLTTEQQRRLDAIRSGTSSADR